MISLADLGNESTELYKEHKAASASTRRPGFCFFDFLNKYCVTCTVNDRRLVAVLIQRKLITFHNIQEMHFSHLSHFRSHHVACFCYREFTEDQ